MANELSRFVAQVKARGWMGINDGKMYRERNGVMERFDLNTGRKYRQQPDGSWRVVAAYLGTWRDMLRAMENGEYSDD